jgi:hypothetical protein
LFKKKIGAKSYGYSLLENADIQTVKWKGISLSHVASTIVNLESMVQLVVNTPEEAFNITYTHQMQRSKADKVIYQRDKSKCISFTFNKRCIYNEQFDTLPWGHQDIPERPTDQLQQWYTRLDQGKQDRHEKTKSRKKKAKGQEEGTKEATKEASGDTRDDSQ